MSVLDDWTVWLQATGASPATIQTRSRILRALCSHQDFDDPAEVTTQQLVRWLAHCRTGWTRYTYYQAANAWCRWLIEEGVRDDNPLARIPRPAHPTNVPRPVPMAIVRKILLDPPSVRARTYVVLAAFAGLRVHEIAKIRGEDADLDAGWLFVTGKGGQRAAVPLHELVARVANRMPVAGFWFRGTDSGHVRTESVSLTVRRALRAAGSASTAHALRHTFGTYVLRQSRDMRVTQEAMRHKSISSTQVYTQVSSADLQAAVRSLDVDAA